MFYTVSYLSLSELTTHTILDLGLIILNLVRWSQHDDRNFIHRMLFANYSDISYSLLMFVFLFSLIYIFDAVLDDFIKQYNYVKTDS